MKASDMIQLLGRRATWKVATGVEIEVCILDAKLAYGEIRVEITPCHQSTGKVWVLLSTVNIMAVAA